MYRKERHMEFPPFQSSQAVVIHAPLQVVWEFNQDLTNIAVYHPRVKQVDLISGERVRGNGVAYLCHLTDGKNTCVEQEYRSGSYGKGLSRLYPKITWG